MILRGKRVPPGRPPPEAPEVRGVHEQPRAQPSFDPLAYPKLIAFACALGVFLLLASYLILDQRTAGGTATPSAKDAVSSAGSSGQSPEATGSTASSVSGAASSPAADAPLPEAPTLNDVLKASADNDWPRVDRLLGLMNAAAPVPSESVVDEASRQALERQDYDAAVRALQPIVARNPDDGDAHNRLAHALLRQGRLKEAHEHVARSLAATPLRGAAWANAAEILAEEDNAVASLSALKVGIHLSQNRERTQAFLDGAGEARVSPKFRTVMAEARPMLPKIPPLGGRPIQKAESR